MKYTLKKFDSEEIKCLFALFAESVLRKPIVENQKHYVKYTKGFRLNKLHRYILDKIYCDEIHNCEGSQLENYLIHLLKASFEGTKIEEIVGKAIERDIFEIALELEKEIYYANLLISPTQIFMLADIELDEKEKKIIIDYHQFIVSGKSRIIEECEKRVGATYEEKYGKLKYQYEKCSSELVIEKSKSRTLEKLAKQKDNTIDSSKEENSLLIDKVKQANAETEVYKEKVHEYETKKVLISKLQAEISELKKHIIELEKTIAILEERSLSPEMIRIICKEVFEDIKTEVIEEEEYISKASSIFSEDETISVSWEKLSADEDSKLIEVVKKMENNDVQNGDIELLDEIENNIQYKYMIIKGLKVIFYKYLEQKIAKKTIDHKFNKS